MANCGRHISLCQIAANIYHCVKLLQTYITMANCCKHMLLDSKHQQTNCKHISLWQIAAYIYHYGKLLQTCIITMANCWANITMSNCWARITTANCWKHVYQYQNGKPLQIHVTMLLLLLHTLPVLHHNITMLLHLLHTLPVLHCFI